LAAVFFLGLLPELDYSLNKVCMKFIQILYKYHLNLNPNVFHVSMGSPGQSSVQITFKVNAVVREKIDREREYTGGTLSEFLNDAVKHYIDYLEQKRIDEIKYGKPKE